MASGPIHPASQYPGSTGNIFPNLYAGGGGNAASHTRGWGVAASLGADSTIELQFLAPPSVPSGTPKLMIRAFANATSGVAKLTVSDGRCATGSSPSAATLTAETQTSLTWTSADVDNGTKVSLTGIGSLAANDIIVVAVKFQTSGWSLAQVSTWLFELIWE